MNDYGQLPYGLSGLARPTGRVSRTITAENPTGEKGGGAKAVPDAAGPARALGVGWKARPCIVIPAGETVTLADIQGSGLLQSQWFTGDIGRDMILRYYWDDQEHPSVECPLPDFFASTYLGGGTGKQAEPFGQISSLPVVVNPNKGLNCFWPMPFLGRCLITLENRSDAPRTCFYQINYALGDMPADTLYFHAQYRQSVPVIAGEVHTLLDGVRGSGHYVGTGLAVGINGEPGWWGEGEMKMYIDGDEDDPTYCGTGLEDYFLGAYDWDVNGTYTPYTTPYAGMQYLRPEGIYASQQRFSLYRWHTMDPVTFERDMRVTIQALGWRSGGRFLPRRDDYASVAYWYQTLPSERLFPLPDRDALEILF